MSDERKTLSEGNKLVLIVDDDEATRELLAAIVREEGFQPETASDGATGLSKIQALGPSLIILDLMLPRLAGFEIIRRLQNGNTSMIPIVVISGRYTDFSTSELIRQESNVVEFMEKPVKIDALAATLRKILGGKQARDDTR